MFTNIIQAPDVKTGDEHWALVDARFYLPNPDQGEREYLEGHIPGAVYAHLDRDLSGKTTGTNGRHPLPSMSSMIDRFSQWGIDENVQVVVYDNASGAYASRLWWMLRYLGHDAVAVLDGGFDAYDGELASGSETRPERTFSPVVQDAMRIDLDEVVNKREEHLLLDARAGERFRGESEPLDPVAGHIPGARNVPSMQNVGDDGRFETADALRKRFDDALAGRSPEDVISYCGSGVTACHNLLAMNIAGLDGAKLYPGSWSEWCANKKRPIETS